MTTQESRIFWVSSRTLFLQQSRVLKYQLNFKPVNHAISKQNHHHFQAPSPDSRLLCSRELAGVMVFGRFGVYNSAHLKQPHSRAQRGVKQAESWINALLRIPFVSVKLWFSPRGRWGSPQERQLCVAPSLPCSCLQCDSSVTAVTHSSCPRTFSYFHGPGTVSHQQLPAQCHIYFSSHLGLLKSPEQQWQHTRGK